LSCAVGSSTSDRSPRGRETAESQGLLWGGGIELACLSNLLRRPISVYEVSEDDDTSENAFLVEDILNVRKKRQFYVKKAGTFGLPLFKDPLQSSYFNEYELDDSLEEDDSVCEEYLRTLRDTDAELSELDLVEKERGAKKKPSAEDWEIRLLIIDDGFLGGQPGYKTGVKHAMCLFPSWKR